MASTIKCPKCGEAIQIDEALSQEAMAAISKKHQAEIETAKKQAEEEYSRRVEKLTSQIEELLDEKRALKEKAEDMEITMKRRLLEEEEKIKLEARKSAEEEHKLRDFDKDKKLNDALQQIEVMKTKMQQGSQQIQGESLETEIEKKLKTEFPMDEISEVKKGQRGADVTQSVVDKLGRTCGIILWESKNAQWSDGWITKLKEDARQARADISILVSVHLPKGTETFAYKDGVWVCGWKHYIALAWAMRFNLVSLYHEKQGSVGKDEKMKILYEYLTGNEFKHRVEGIVESFTGLQEELETEKRYFNKKWARQEKEIRKVIDHTHGMWGDLQGVIGKSLPEIDTLRLES